VKNKIYEIFVQYKLAHDGNRPSFGYVSRLIGISRQAVKYHIDRDDRFYWNDGELCIRGGEWQLKARASATGHGATGSS
jgi:hypothetical protein